MADRMNQFPTLPANFAPTLPGQGDQLSQQSPQQQQQDATLGGLPNPDHSRLWQQMQQQQQLRAANGGPGDINGTQVNQQVCSPSFFSSVFSLCSLSRPFCLILGR
jgi:hypothetical protein